MTQTNSINPTTALIALFDALDAANIAASKARQTVSWVDPTDDDPDFLTDETLRLISDTTFRFKEITRQMVKAADKDAR